MLCVVLFLKPWVSGYQMVTNEQELARRSEAKECGQGFLAEGTEIKLAEIGESLDKG